MSISVRVDVNVDLFFIMARTYSAWLIGSPFRDLCSFFFLGTANPAGCANPSQ